MEEKFEVNYFGKIITVEILYKEELRFPIISYNGNSLDKIVIPVCRQEEVFSRTKKLLFLLLLHIADKLTDGNCLFFDETKIKEKNIKIKWPYPDESDVLDLIEVAMDEILEAFQTIYSHIKY